MAQTTVERIVAEIERLSPRERVTLIKSVVDTLIKPERPAEPRQLTYGEFRGARMSTEDDFKIAEWHPESREMDGP